MWKHYVYGISGICIFLYMSCTDLNPLPVIQTPQAEELHYVGTTPHIRNEEGVWVPVILITTEAELQDIGSGNTDTEGRVFSPSANYLLGNDITLTKHFSPLPEFTGIFSGNYHRISNLYIEISELSRDDVEGSDPPPSEPSTLPSGSSAPPSEDYVGLFSEIGKQGEIRNMDIELRPASPTNPSIEGANYVGALAGRNHGRIINIEVVEGGRIEGQSYVGGLIGHNASSKRIEKVKVYVDVRVPEELEEDSFFIGGLAGLNSSNGSIADSHAYGDISGGANGHNVGGFVGLHNASGSLAIQSSEAHGSVKGNTGIGGFVGTNMGSIETSLAYGYVEGDEYVGGFAGWNIDYVPGDIRDATEIELKSRDAIISRSHARGDVNTRIPVNINFNHVGGFVGLNASTPDRAYAIEQSSTQGDVEGYSNTGGFAGTNSGSMLENRVEESFVEGHGYTGGFVGHNEEAGTIVASSTFAEVLGTHFFTGGFAGQNTGGSISESRATGRVRGANAYVGGFVGTNEGILVVLDMDIRIVGSISDSVASGTVEGENHYVGGFVGTNEGGIISRSAATGIVQGTHRSEDQYIGGFVGQNNASGSITQSFSAGGYVDGSAHTGGFAGINNAQISDSYTRVGEVKGSSANYKGGFVGQNNGHIKNSYTTTTLRIDQNLDMGMFAGWNARNAYIYNSYWGLASDASRVSRASDLWGIGEGSISDHVVEGISITAEGTSDIEENAEAFYGWEFSRSVWREIRETWPQLSWEFSE